MDLTKLTITDLKAMAFDEIQKANQCQVNLNLLNAEMQTRNKQVDKLEIVKPAGDGKDKG